MSIQNQDLKNILIVEAYKTESLLKKLIKFNQYQIKEAGTFLSLFRKTDFKSIHTEATDLYLAFDEHRINIDALKGNFADFTSEQRKFYEILDKYVNLLFDAVEIMQYLAKERYELSKSARNYNGELTLQKSIELGNKYNDIISQCDTVAVELSKAYTKISNES